jgi:hypothetical protein
MMDLGSTPENVEALVKKDDKDGGFRSAQIDGKYQVSLDPSAAP